MECCMVCETPFGLLNCINIAYHKSKETKIDLFICKLVPGWEYKKDILEATGLFREIYTYEYPRNKFNISKIHILEKVFSNFTPKVYVQGLTDQKVKFVKYKYIYLQNYADFVLSIILIQKLKGDIIFYDDGTGSYCGRIGFDGLYKRKKLYSLLGYDIKSFFPRKMLVNNINFCNTEWETEVVQLPKLKEEDEKLKKLLYKVFNCTDIEIYKRKRIVFLSQPRDKMPIDKIKTDYEVLHVLKEICGDTLVVRPHPRDKDILNIGEMCDVDKGNSLWELLCMNIIDENKVLVGMLSSAQFMPKYLFDKEPYIIFTLPLYRNCFSKEYYNKLFNMINELKERYIDKNKVILINTLEDLYFCERLFNF